MNRLYSVKKNVSRPPALQHKYQAVNIKVRFEVIFV